MPYMQGLTRVQGDPGFFSFLGKAIGTVGKIVPGPIGIGLRAGAGLLTGGQKRGSVATPGFAGPQQQQQIQAARQLGAQPTMAQLQGCPPKKRRRIDPLNIKALRRANTRQRSFLRAVDRTLKTMPTKGSVASRRKKIAGAVRKTG